MIENSNNFRAELSNIRMLAFGSRAMNYCDLDDAFQQIGGAPSPGCGTDYATRAARKEERRKARRCKGPAATYLDLDKDPDRQQFSKLPEIPPMNPNTGLREHSPVGAPQGSCEPFTNSGNIVLNTEERHQPYQQEECDSSSSLSQIPTNIPGPAKEQQRCGKYNFFGAQGPDDEPFADYIPDQSDYKLQPDFAKAFQESGSNRPGGGMTLPNPSVNNYWKPLTPSGAQTSFIDHLPPPGGKYYQAPSSGMDMNNAELMRKIDKIFARLDDMNQSSSPEQMATEIMMFISSGIFILFLMDLLVKKGGKLRF